MIKSYIQFYHRNPRHYYNHENENRRSSSSKCHHQHQHRPPQSSSSSSWSSSRNVQLFHISHYHSAHHQKSKQKSNGHMFISYHFCQPSLVIIPSIIDDMPYHAVVIIKKTVHSLKLSSGSSSPRPFAGRFVSGTGRFVHGISRFARSFY